ncbi:MAG TPA: HAD hydrolase-like protein, partial [Candidatus Saccharimonadales bacterium]|nr:HAD hydrolase-like protein [Candidatus Saccharimonadales bacterium]
MILALFDVDGTLVNAGGAGRAALCRAFETEFGSERVMEKAADVRFDGRTDKEIIAEIGARAGVTPRDLAARREAFERTYIAILEEMLREEGRARPLPGAGDLLGALRAGGAHLGL